jgi:uncharacterized membrane protein YkvI
VVDVAREYGFKVQVFRVAATYVGTVVGAGFASGQETLRFFASYGRIGLLGIAVATVLFCVYGVWIMELGRRLKARSHREVLHYACGPTVGKVMDGVITIFLGATLMIMIAGGGAIVHEQLGMPKGIGTIFTSAVTGLTVLAGMRGIMAANSVVVPMLTAAVAGLSAATLQYHGLSEIIARSMPWPLLMPVKSWLLATLLYVGYNLVLAISVLAPLGAEVNDRRVLVTGGVAGGLTLGVLAAGIKLAVSAHMPEIGMVEVPMLHLARLHPSPVQWFYTLILWAEIYTTAIGCAYGFAQRTAAVMQTGYRGVVVIITALALFGSGIGFSNLLAVLYPVFGFVTLVVMVGLGLVWWRRGAV